VPRSRGPAKDAVGIDFVDLDGDVHFLPRKQSRDDELYRLSRMAFATWYGGDVKPTR
jgi:hypothetical protein